MNEHHSQFTVMQDVEKISSNGTLAYIIRGELEPTKTTFFTPQFKQQIGYIVYPAGGQIQRHLHRPLERRLIGTSEVIIVRRGRCQIDVYNDERELVASHELRRGDIMLMVGGGHGFRMQEDTVLWEVKQGPYTDLDEKTKIQTERGQCCSLRSRWSCWMDLAIWHNPRRDRHLSHSII
jgi:hypothetical protein